MANYFNPLVSIVIPVYNGANYLSQALDSALAQTYSNVEILVINDGSCDDGATDSIVKSYGEKVRYFIKPNGGVSSALNFGIDNMNGEYFSWLSHDDLYEPEKIEKEVALLAEAKDKETTIICCSDNLIDGVGKIIYHPTKQLDGLYAGPDLFDVFFTRHLNINGCTLLIPKHLFDKIGRFSKFRYIQDTECWVKFMLNGVSFRLIPDKLVKMRVHADQVTQRMPELFYLEMYEFSQDIIDNYVRNGMMSKSNIQSFLIYHYKNHIKDIYKQIEKVTDVNLPVKAYYLMYGYLFNLASTVYSKLFKR